MFEEIFKGHCKIRTFGFNHCTSNCKEQDETECFTSHAVELALPHVGIANTMKDTIHRIT